jgi:hypothetical protein
VILGNEIDTFHANVCINYFLIIRRFLVNLHPLREPLCTSCLHINALFKTVLKPKKYSKKNKAVVILKLE